MKLERTQRYKLHLTDNTYSVVGPNGEAHFTAPATERFPKLYVASRRGTPVYVGIRSQSMATRVHFGLRASGAHGYHGYRMRGGGNFDLDIWYLDDAPPAKAAAELECIEAEVVYFTRKTLNQWPEFQTEIHFHTHHNSFTAMQQSGYFSTLTATPNPPLSRRRASTVTETAVLGGSEASRYAAKGRITCSEP